jgi:hypothetical protein
MTLATEGDVKDNSKSLDNNSDNDSSNDSDEDFYAHLVKSIRSDTGLEIGVQIHWPTLANALELSTILPETSLAPIFHGTQWAGTRVWQASIVALQYLLSLQSSGDDGGGTMIQEHHDNDELQSSECSPQTPFINSKSRILELGAGLAVPSMILRALRQCDALVTDYGSLFSQLQANIRQNETLLHLSPSKSNNNMDDHDKETNATNDDSSTGETTDCNISSTIQAWALDWSKQGVQSLLADLATASNKPVHFDVIFNCDCLFEPLYGSSENLVECQLALLQEFPNAYMLTVCERRNHDGIYKYLKALQESPVVQRVEQVFPKSFEYPKEVELYRIYGTANDS